MNDSESLEEIVFHEAIGLPRAERAAFVHARCGHVPQTFQRVVELLDGHEKDSEYLEASPAIGSNPPAQGIPAKPFEYAPGDLIGNYRLIERLGEGGCGVVFLAEQAEPVRRRAALKVIKLGMDTNEFVARFEAERQALALMDHPNIARVFEAGSTPTGRPFFAMELIRGVSLTRYCDEHRLGVEQRLELFITVCHAIQHAHQKGIIHRDLKPSNILVATQDGQAVPKVIDFGIAKAMHGPLTDKTLATLSYAFLGTPAYTSPEQIDNVDIDTRSDIYSLGVLLYELLTSHSPFPRSQLEQAGLEETRRLILEVDPPRPSIRVANLAPDERANLERKRRVDAGQLSSQLRSDLDWIVMRCLEKDRARRYETTDALSSDVRRYLNSEPLTARPLSKVYWLRKFVRRHRGGVAVSLGIMGLTVAGLVVVGALVMREHAALNRALLSESAESTLREQAEEAQKSELLRASRTARDLARKFFAQGHAAEGLAYLVHVARTVPGDSTIAPQLVSALTSRNFFLPVGGPLQFPAPVVFVGYIEEGRRIAVYCEDGTIAFIDRMSGAEVRTTLPRKLTRIGVYLTGQVWVVVAQDNMILAVDPHTGRVLREIAFQKRIVAPYARGSVAPIFLACLEDQSVVVADVLTGDVRTLPFKRVPNSQIEVSANGRWLSYSEHPYHEWQLWDLKTGVCRATRRVSGALERIVFNLDGTRLLATHEAQPGQYGACVWSVPEADPVTETLLFDHGLLDHVFVPSFSPDGTLFSLATTDQQQLYDTSTGAAVGPPLTAGLLRSWYGPDQRRAAHSAGDNGYHGALRGFEPFRGPLFCGTAERPLIITASATNGGKELIVHDARTGDPVLPKLDHEFAVADIRLNEDGNTLLTLDGNGAVRLWDLRTGTSLTEPSFPQRVSDRVVAVSPDAHEIVISGADGMVHRMRVGRGAARPLIYPPFPPPQQVRFIDGTPTQLLWLKADRADIVDVASGMKTSAGFALPEALVAGNPARRLVVRPDLRLIVAQTSQGQWLALELDRSGIHNSVTLKGASTSGAAVFLSPAGEIAAMISEDEPESARFWNVRSGEPIGKPLTYTRGIAIGGQHHPAGFSLDGRYFVAGSIDGQIKVCDPATGKILCEMQSYHSSRVIEAALNKNGSRAITIAGWGEAQLWNARSGNLIRPVLSETGPVEGVAFSLTVDDFMTRSSNGVVRIWNSDTGAQIGASMGHPGFHVGGTAFGVDGRCIATGAADSTAQIWDGNTGQAMTDPMIHQSPVASCEMSFDGRFLLTEEEGTPAKPAHFCVWSIPCATGNEPAPEWLLQLATLCAAKKINETAEVVEAPEALGLLEDISQKLNRLPDDAPYVEYGKWFLLDKNSRPIAPGFEVTAQEADEIAAGRRFQ